MQTNPTPSTIDIAAISGLKGSGNLSHEQLLVCVEVGKAITSQLDPEKLIATIMEKVSKLLPSETWSLLLLDEETQELKFEISVDLEPETVKNIRLKLGQGVAGQAALQQCILVVEDVSRCEYFYDTVDEISGQCTQSVLCVPIVYGKRTLGVLEVVNAKDVDATNISLLTMLSDYIAIAVENTQRFRKMQEMALRDDLTGLYNQRYLFQSLRKLIPYFRKNGGSLSLIFMDMDDFKGVVDRLGHLYGSRVLNEVAERIKSYIEEPAFGVAYGGDEFVLVLPDYDRKQATDMAICIRKSIKAKPYLTQWGKCENLTASFGVASFPDDADDSTSLLALADKSMFFVKSTGKDHVCSSPMDYLPEGTGSN
jgi:diguanylate cyclase (GGDEF)-like protein